MGGPAPERVNLAEKGGLLTIQLFNLTSYIIFMEKASEKFHHSGN
jgi:hypothetical protein